MRKLLLLGVLFGLITSCVTSKRTAFLTLPSSTTPIEQIDLAAYESKYGKYDGVYLLWENTLEHVGIKDDAFLPTGSSSGWEFFNVVKRKYLILNPDVQELSTFDIKISPGAKLGSLYLQVIYPDGEIRKFGEMDLKKDIDGNNSQIYKFAYPNIQKGCIIEEGFELKYNIAFSIPPLSHDIPLQFYIPCEHLSFSYAYPDWWQIQVKKIMPDSIPYYKIKDDPKSRKTTITYEADNVPALQKEVYSPFFKERANYLEFMVTKLQMLGKRYESNETWNDLMISLRKESMNKEGFLSNHVENTTEDIVRDIQTPLEKLDTIVTYLQTKIEPTNEYDNNNFKKILIEKKGSISRITGLAEFMLSKAGLDAQYLLVHSAKDGYFDKDYVSYTQFTIPAVGVIIENEKYVVFPYAKIPITYIPQNFQGQLALGISGDKQSNEAEFWEIPSGDQKENIVEEEYNLRIDEAGLISVSETKTFRGSNAYFGRRALEDLTDDELVDELEELLTYTDGDIKIESREIKNLEAYKKPLIIKLNYTIDNLVTLTPEEVIFQTGGLFSPISGTKYKIDTEDRQNPIRIYYNETLKKHITLNFPETWKIDTPLENIEFQNIFGQIMGEYHISEGRLIANQQRFLKRSEESKEKINELLELTGEKSKLAIPSLVFKVQTLESNEN